VKDPLVESTTFYFFIFGEAVMVKKEGKKMGSVFLLSPVLSLLRVLVSFRFLGFGFVVFFDAPTA